ncbi:MAG: ABC transporter permease [Candidatus Bathyarchaeia archaeon]
MSGLSDFKRLILSSKLSVLGLLLVSIFLLAAILYAGTGGKITPYSPFAGNLQIANQPPDLTHIFGTDFQGRDIFSRVIAALPTDLGIPILVVLLSSLIGVLLGFVAGYNRGLISEVILRITDVFLAFPTIIIVLAVAATLGPSLLNAVLAIAFVWWPPYVRLVRGGVLEVITEDFVAASKALNSSFFYIMLKDIIPNILPTMIVYATIDLGTALLSLSTLGFLGVGIGPDSPELGSMVGAITYNLYTYPWEGLIPAVIVMIIVASFSFLGDGVREVLDVNLQAHMVIKERLTGAIGRRG